MIIGLDGGILAQPVNQIGVNPVKVLGIIFREVGLSNGNPPLKLTLIGLHLPGEDFEQGGIGQLVLPHEGYFLAPHDYKANIVEHFLSVDGFTETLDGQNVFTGLALGLEPHVGISPRRWGDVI